MNGSVVIKSSEKLCEFKAFNSVLSVEGRVEITDVCGISLAKSPKPVFEIFRRLTSIKGDLHVIANSGLTTINGFHDLKLVKDDLVIRKNSRLERIDFPNLNMQNV